MRFLQYGLVVISTAFSMADATYAEPSVIDIDAQTAIPVPAVDPKLVLAQQVITQSGLQGLSEQARHVAQGLLNELQLPLAQQYQLVGRVSSAWSPDQLQPLLSQHLPKDEESLKALLALLERADMATVRQLELDAVGEQTSSQYQQYIERLRQQPPPANRQQALQQLDQAMHFSALMTQVRASVYADVQQVVEDWQPPEDWQTQVQAQVLEFLLYVHRRTSNQQLQQLTQVYQTKELQDWLQASQQALPRI